MNDVCKIFGFFYSLFIVCKFLPALWFKHMSIGHSRKEKGEELLRVNFVRNSKIEAIGP